MKERTLVQAIDKCQGMLVREDVKTNPESLYRTYELMGKYLEAYKESQENKSKIIYTDKFRIQLGD